MPIAEATRSQLHFTGPDIWLNDPNGLIRLGETYHLFFQCNPFGSEWGHMSWGHAVSDDLVHWRHLPIALAEREDANGDTVQIYSGTVAPLRPGHGLSGIPDDASAVACFTEHRTRPDGRAVQSQALAWTLDDGETWVDHPLNPVLDLGRTDFRDPRLFFDTSRSRWVMVVAASADHAVEFYVSADGLGWELTDRFVHPQADTVLECPDLVLLPVEGTDEQRWTLFYSLGHPENRGPGTVFYVTGEWDGEQFLAGSMEPRRVDHGHDFFALQFFAGLPAADRPLGLAWAACWQYAAVVPTAPWRGAMTMPREFSLVEVEGEPAPALRQRVPRSITSSFEEPLEPAESVRGPFITSWRSSPTDSGACGIRLIDSQHGAVCVTVERGDGRIVVDRTTAPQATFHPLYPCADIATLPRGLASSEIDVTVFVDGTIIEVFVADGRVAMTSQWFPSASGITVERIGSAPEPAIRMWSAHRDEDRFDDRAGDRR